jgi:UDP-N-acetylmuramoylalanine--D-glutamate ligase
MKHLQNLHVLVLGLGDSGLAMARWCASHGSVVSVWDTRAPAPQAAALAEHVPSAVVLSGPLTEASFEGIQLVLKSPGLSPLDDRIAAPLAASELPVQSELDLFARALADLKDSRSGSGAYAPKVLAITGTNGKTTTTSMAALLIARTGKRVAMAGNIGPTMLQTLSDAISVDELPDVWILELSSFQLDEVKHFEPDAAVVLNLSEDHLDWHGSMAAYTAAKVRVFGENAVMVINRDDAAVERLIPAPAPGKGRFAKPTSRNVVRFGTSAPTHPGDFGLKVENGIPWLVRALESDDTIKRVRKTSGKDAEPEELHIQRLMPADALRVRGRHNAANALAALALATAIDCPLAPMLHGLRDYAGEPHRMQFIATLGGVDAFDDSKGTNVGATVAALNGLGDDRAPSKLVVILGGDGKGQDFAPLAAPVQQHVRAVATIGRDAALIEAALENCGVTMQRFDTLQAATRWAYSRAQSGDAVLLSPACASLDMFRNYGHRAEVFVAEVHAMAAEQGEVIA